jgi:NAD(P)H dehydrogenase (quinone)
VLAFEQGNLDQPLTTLKLAFNHPSHSEPIQTTSMPKYVLTGADGNLGGAAAEFAIEIAKPEDKLVFTSYKLEDIPKDTLERWLSKGIEVHAASYDDIESLKKVFEGADAVAFISTWLIGDRRRGQAKNVVEAAKAMGVKRVCYTSFVGAGAPADAKEEDIPFLPRDHHFVEQTIYESGLDYSIQRNFLYMDNIPMFFAPSWKFCGNRCLTYVARDDCGRVFAALLLGRGEPNKVYEVTGPEPITNEELFHFMNNETGYKAQYVDMPDEELQQWWLDHGLPKDVYGDFSQLPMKLCIGDLMCSSEMLANGSMNRTTDTVEKLTGRKPLGYRDYLLRYRDIFPAP